MPTLLPEDHQGIGDHKGPWPPRFLEGPDGVVRLYHNTQVLGTAAGNIAHQVCTTPKGAWREWLIPVFFWARPAALKLVQGASIQQMIGKRYKVVGGNIYPLYAFPPRIHHLQLAEVIEGSISEQQLFERTRKPA